MSWTDVVHLALYDLTLKTGRRHHHLDSDLTGHMLSHWSRFQLFKHHNTLSEQEKRSRIRECLVSESQRFERGSETGQSDDLWCLRSLAPPPRPVYRVSEVGIVSERTVLSEVRLETTLEHGRGEVFHEGDLVTVYNDYQVKQAAEVKKKQNKLKSSQLISKKRKKSVIKGKKLLKSLPNKDLKKQKTKLPLLVSNLKKKRGRKPKLSQPESSPPKMLPHQISKMLHNRGYPKVAMKFASIIPAKPEAVSSILVDVQEKKTKQSSPKKKSKKEGPAKEKSSEETKSTTNSLSSLIPVRADYLGDNNPFHLGSVEEQRQARKIICNRKLVPEDLTSCRSRIRKRKYKLDLEFARKVWRKETNSKVVKVNKKTSLIESKRKLQFAGKVTTTSGEKKMILLSPESQNPDVSEVEM